MSSPTSPKTDVRRALSAIALLLVAAGCGTDVQDFSRAYFSEPVSLTKQDRPEFQLAPEAPAWEPPEHDNKNGTFSQMLWFEPEQATHIMALLKDHPAITALTQKTVEPGMTRDLLGNGTGPATITNEGLLLTGTREALDAAIALVEFVGTSIPQFEVEARIVEVRETDEFGFGIDSYILNRNQPYNPSNPGAPLVPNGGLFDRGRIQPGIPAIPGSASSAASPLLLELGTISDSLQFDIFIQALKSLTKADVLSAPRIAVLNGHKAEFNAGEEIPIFEQNVVGTSVTITTKFKKIGIGFTVVPRLVSKDIVRLGVKAKVESLTGVTTLQTPTLSISSPITAVREATTYVDVRNGSAVVLGGLFTTSKADANDRVPILGEIPVINLLFSSTHTKDARTNLLFFIRPRLITPSGDTGLGVIVPPTESRPEGGK